MTTLISGIITLISAIIFIFSVVPSKYQPSVGDKFAHINPGNNNNPNEPANPFVAIYTVEEIKDSKVRCKWRVLRCTGEVLVYEQWKPAYDFSRFDKRF